LGKGKNGKGKKREKNRKVREKKGWK